MERHDCNNMTCQLLNPSIERLLEYEDLKKRVTKAEEIFFGCMKNIDKCKSFPLGLFGWSHAHNIFQLLNVEFIRELAKYIKEIDPKIILEVGAGNGLLGKYLTKELGKEIIMTDDYSWWGRDGIKLQNKDVIRMEYEVAINRYKPDLIIASWIPYKRWWTNDFKQCESVSGYLLIGEGHGGCTGSDMDWGTDWLMKELEGVENFSICRTDNGYYERSIPLRHTNVTYFKRPEIG